MLEQGERAAPSRPPAQGTPQTSGGSSRGGKAAVGNGTGSANPVVPQTNFEEQHGLTTWPGEVPDHVDISYGASRVTGYPGLRDNGRDVSLIVWGTRAERDAAHRRGVARLLSLTTKSPGDYVVNSLSTAEKLALAASPYPSVKAMAADALLLLCREALPETVVLTGDDFESARARVNDGIVDRLFAVVSQVAVVCRLNGEIVSAIKSGQSMALIPHFTHVRAQLEGLFHPGFLGELTIATLQRYPVYLRGILYRIDKLRESAARDRTAMTEYDTAFGAFTRAGGVIPVPVTAEPRIVAARWALEELRISLFAQQLGAAGPVSVQRITKMVAPHEG